MRAGSRDASLRAARMIEMAGQLRAASIGLARRTRASRAQIESRQRVTEVYVARLDRRAQNTPAIFIAVQGAMRGQR